MHINFALSQACQRVGRKVPFWVQGAGGNVSVKDEDWLHIKASGWRLDGITESQGIARLKLERLQQEVQKCLSEEEYSRCLSQSVEPNSPRPSMESGFHALLPGKWVIHIHSLVALLMVHQSRHRPDEWSVWLKGKNTEDTLVLPPTLPGLELSQRIGHECRSPILLLENHGVILQANTPEIIADWERLESSFIRDWNYESLAKPLPLEGIAPCPLRIYFPDTAVFLDRMQKLLATDGRLPKDALTRDKDATELWAATSALYHAETSLSELPPEISSRIAGLPTEVFRRAETAKTVA